MKVAIGFQSQVVSSATESGSSAASAFARSSTRPDSTEGFLKARAISR